MNRDPFYQEIIVSLGRQLDPTLFERCATDLLRKIYPTLVPIRGGDDAGMDGAIAELDESVREARVEFGSWSHDVPPLG